MTINERFKEIRLNLNKTQADFGEQCGLGRAVIANIENNRSPVTPLYIKVVVDNFGVNEEWLIKGTGDMFLETKEQYIDRLAERYGLDDFMKKVITAYSELSHKEAHARGYASNHGDPEHWLARFGKDMNWFRSRLESSRVRVNAEKVVPRESAAEVISQLKALGFAAAVEEL